MKPNNLFMIAAFFLAITGICQAQVLELEWAKLLGNTGSDEGYCLGIDAFNNVYTVGAFSGTVDFDPGPGTVNLSSEGPQNLFIQKLDPSGNFLWAKRITGGCRARSIAVGPGGNLVIVGYFFPTADLDPGPGTVEVISHGEEDIFILALDWEGNFLWGSSIGGPDWDEAVSVIFDCNFHIRVLGRFMETVDFDPGPGVFNLTSEGFDDCFILELDSNGDFVWATRFGTNKGDIPGLLAVDDQCNYFVLGGFEKTIDLDPGPGTFFLETNGGYDLFVHKSDASGNFLWAKSIGGVEGDYGKAICTDPIGNVVIAGIFNEIVDFDPGPGTYLLGENSADNFLFVWRLTADGAFAGAIALGQLGALITPSSVLVDKAGNIYLGGYFTQTIDFDPGPGEFFQSVHSLSDMFLLKISPLGEFQWVRTMGHAGIDRLSAIALDSENRLLFTGYFSGMIDIDPTNGIILFISAGHWDAFTAKWNQPTVAVSDLTFPSPVILYPNPASGLFSIDLGAFYPSVTIAITNLSGQLLEQQRYDSISNLTLEIDGPPGMYFIQVCDEEGRQARLKLIKI